MIASCSILRSHDLFYYVCRNTDNKVTTKLTRSMVHMTDSVHEDFPEGVFMYCVADCCSRPGGKDITSFSLY